MTVEADKPVVGLEGAREEEDNCGHQGPLVVAEEDQASNGGDFHALFHHWKGHVEQKKAPFHAACELLYFINAGKFTFAG